MKESEEQFTVIQVVSGGTGSGGSRQAVLLAAGLRSAGHRVVFCAPQASTVLQWAREAGLEAHPLSFGGLRGQWRASRALRRLASEVEADVVHAHHTKGHNVALLSTLGGGFPAVVVNRGVIFRAVIPAKFKTRRVAAIIANSASVRDVLTGQGVRAKKIHVIHNAKEPLDLDRARSVLPSLKAELELSDGAGPVIGAVGSGRPEKGFQFLVEAAPRILRRFPGARFVLVGGRMETLLSRANDLGIGDHFRFPGYRQDASDLMALFDVFVFPSVDMDSCPNVLLEAMGAGLPVVGSDVGGVKELLEDGRTGFLVAPGDPAALAGGACRILEMPDAGAAFGRRARERIRREFTVGEKTARTVEVYREVLGRHDASHRREREAS